MNRLLTILVYLGLTHHAYAEECRSLNSVEWVLGEWTTSSNRVVIREHWHRVSDDTFEGESTTKSVTDGEIVNYETLRLVEMSDSVFYIAKVTDNDLPVPFRLTQCSDHVAVFENPDHDAPQRLIYRLVYATGPGEPALEVRLEGDRMKDFSLWFQRP